MNFVQTLEECYRDLASASRRDGQSYPGVKEASERGLWKLRQLQSSYIQLVRLNQAPNTSHFRHSELLHPILLAANYPNATTAMLATAFRSLRLFMEADAILPADAIHILRVYQIQSQVVTAYFRRNAGGSKTNNNKASSNNKPQPPNRRRNASPKSNNNNTTASSPSGGGGGGSSSSSSWLFGWGSSATTTASTTTTTNAAAATTTTSCTTDDDDDDEADSLSTSSQNTFSDSPSPQQNMTMASSSSLSSLAVQGKMSSSTGGVGGSSTAHHHGHHDAAQMDRLALEILSSILQLVELFCTVMSDEEWNMAVSLSCQWAFLSSSSSSSHNNNTKHAVVRQASATTLSQLVSWLFRTHTNNSWKPLAIRTWDDLLALAIPTTTTSTTTTTSRRYHHGHSAGAFGHATPPPAPYVALELLLLIWKEHGQTIPDHLFVKSLGVTQRLLVTATKNGGGSSSHHSRHHHNKLKRGSDGGDFVDHSDTAADNDGDSSRLLLSLRLVQWTTSIIGRADLTIYTIECRELLQLLMLKRLAAATDACRRYDEFEDGYVYNNNNSNNNNERGGGSAVDANPTTTAADHNESSSANGPTPPTHIPMFTLWKAAMAIEALYQILSDDYDARLKPLLFSTSSASSSAAAGNSSSSVIDQQDAILHRLTEALSDFVTIVTSCRDHMVQTVDFFHGDNAVMSIQPTVFRRAETNIIKYGDTAMLTDDTKGGNNNSHSNAAATSTSAKAAAAARTDLLVLGEAVWMAMRCLLRIGECLGRQQRPRHIATDADLDRSHVYCVQQVFSPSLAVYQHVLKRFVGSRDLVQLALEGYSILARSCCRLDMERKVLITSLSKLSLPAWGRHDGASLLRDHHVQALTCLLQIIHHHCDAMAPEWEVIMWTLEELSILDVSSPLLSEVAYNGSLAIAATYERLAPFSTSLGDNSLVLLAQALADICRTRMSKRDVVGVSETVLPERLAPVELKRSTSGDEPAQRESISGKIMSMGARVIYGSSNNNDEKELDDPLRAERPKRSYSQDYNTSFLAQLAKSKATVRANQIGRLPFCLVLLSHLTLLNLFRPRKCTEQLLKAFTDLASTSPAVRPFVMDLTALIALNKLNADQKLPIMSRGESKVVVEDPTQSQLLAVEPVDPAFVLRYLNESQVEVLSQICTTIQNAKSADLAASSLEVLSTILEGTGQTLRGEVWSLIIDAIASLSGDAERSMVDRTSAEWSSCCLMAFRTLKLIIDDFLDCLPEHTSHSKFDSNLSLLNACCSFVVSKHDINTSLTAIGQLWTIAEQDSDTTDINRVLSRFVMVSSDERAEVRNAAINTLFSCVAGRGASFSLSDWKFCLTDAIFRVEDVVLEKLHMNDDRESTSASQERRTSRYKVRQHYSRDSSEKMWMATLVLVVRGLCRVLRGVFDMLLHEIDSLTWFPEVWDRTLDMALQASCQSGEGRETLDLRFAGMEMLVLCCQLPSNSGAQAGLSPARVGTNMEVVNGALRSVRTAHPTRQSNVDHDRKLSDSASATRRALFDQSFSVLEALASYMSTESADADTKQQVVSRLGSNLQKMYSCCKNDELKVSGANFCLDAMLSIGQNGESTRDLAKTMEARFIAIVQILLAATTAEPKARFLNQGQRVSLDLLRGMASNGSALALSRLVELAGSAFFVRKDSETDQSDHAEHDEGAGQTTVTLLNFECASAASSLIAVEAVSDECRMYVLLLVLNSFLQEHGQKKETIWIRRYYKLFLPIMESGLQSVVALGSTMDPKYHDCPCLLYQRLIKCFRHLLQPVEIGRGLMKVQRVPEVLSFIPIAIKATPLSVANEFSAVLTVGATDSYEAAKMHATSAESHPEGDLARKSRRHRDELIKLFASCFAGVCLLSPQSPQLRSLAKHVLDETADPDLLASAQAVAAEASILIVKTIAEHETIVISLFGALCKMLVAEMCIKKLRDAIVTLLSTIDVQETVSAMQSRCDAANNRAATAERRMGELTLQLQAAQEENVSLQEALREAEADTPRSTSFWGLG